MPPAAAGSPTGTAPPSAPRTYALSAEGRTAGSHRRFTRLPYTARHPLRIALGMAGGPAEQGPVGAGRCGIAPVAACGPRRSTGPHAPGISPAATVAPSSQHASASALPGSPVTVTASAARRQPRPVVTVSMARTAPVTSLPPWT